MLGQSEPLAVAETPLGYPLYGGTLALGRLAPDIAAGRALALSGKRQRLRLRKGQPDATMQLTDGGSVAIKEGDLLRLLAAPEEGSGSLWLTLSPSDFGQRMVAPGSTQLRLTLLDRDGRDGQLLVPAAAIELAPAEKDDQEVQEIVFIGDLPTSVTQDRDRTTFVLAAPLAHCYDRETTQVNANVAHATHGETVSEFWAAAMRASPTRPSRSVSRR